MAGSGSRFESRTPKQFHRLAGKAIYQHTLARFIDSNLFDEILLVCSAERVEQMQKRGAPFCTSNRRRRYPPRILLFRAFSCTKPRYHLHSWCGASLCKHRNSTRKHCKSKRIQSSKYLYYFSWHFSVRPRTSTDPGYPFKTWIYASSNPTNLSLSPDLASTSTRSEQRLGQSHGRLLSCSGYGPSRAYHCRQWGEYKNHYPAGSVSCRADFKTQAQCIEFCH